MTKFTAMPTPAARAFQMGQPDSHGQIPEQHISIGGGSACRHCLRQIPAGTKMLILGYRPFEGLHPYAESGPIFLCAETCDSGSTYDLPEILQIAPDYLVKGYTAEDRIQYGTGKIVASAEIPAYAAEVLEREDVAYLHVRSARNNCYQLRIDAA